MDTFNFSFFEDKPQESQTDTEETSSSPSANTSESEAKPDDSDPFGFDAFDMSGGAPDADVEDLTFAAPNAPASAPEDDFDLSSLSSEFSLNENESGKDEGFPSLAFAPSATTPSEPIDTGFDDIRVENGNMEDAFADLSFTPESLTAEANELLTLGTTDSFDLPDLEPSAEPESFAGFETPVELEALSEPEPPSAPEIATVLPPVDSSEIRASVVPAVFLTPASAPPAPPLETPPVPEVEEEEIVAETPPPAPTPAPREAKARAKPARFLTTDDPYGEVAPPRDRLRVAILGASGIGKNHARWFAKNSCDVVSFLGSSDESVDLTRAHLRAHMGFSGQGYSDLGRLLNETQPQAVCIASPSHLHYAQAMQCLEAGIHVLCEKPLVYAPTRPKRENADGARELLKAASRRNLVLATQLQYGAATPILCRLAGVSPFEVGDFAMEIETTNPKSPRDPKELWVDLAPHPLSVAQYLAGDGGEIVEETLQIMPSRSAYTSEVTARFGVRCDGGRLLMCRVIVRWFDKIVDNRDPRRRFSFNGRVVQYSGVKSPDGTYIAQYVAPDGYISHYSDPVDYLIGNFVRTCWDEDQLILSSEQGVQNLDWLLTTVEKL
ncbi:inositol 2-dehydrogenase/D-chiro-inositol 3-dehydrogenase [Abditibacteriota bacterium]|nr:inositol 2-dehydrogenase/D-chiro-inositol 3-dehydrogenase [Abditibacteriota bacterium]